MPAAPASTAEVYELLRQSGIYTPARLAALIPNPETLPQDPQKALGVLVSKGILTRFQAEQFMQGRHRGFRLGAYVIQSQLGRGGMGAVYLAEHQELRRKVAVKVLMAAKDADHNLAIERFIRESRAAAALDHPNIVRIHDVSRTGGVPFLVMEYVDGETLQQILDREGAIHYAKAADYISQAAAGLQHAYEKGFIHRDIKPANLMKDREGVVKLLDMGLARSNIDPGDKLTERLDHGAVVGTADFIAPEQALNSPDVDIRADIYSLGASFFALVTGKPPFGGNTAQKLIQHQIADVPDLSSIDGDLPDEMIEIATTMLAKRPEDRYQTPGEVIAALAPWVANTSRVMAGLSRTNIGASGDLQQTIDRIAAGRSSTRVRRGSDSSVNAGRIDTGRITASATTRDSTKRLNKKKKKTPKANKLAVIGTVVAGILAAGAVIWAASGSSKPPPKTDDDKAVAKVEAPPGPPRWTPGTHANELAAQEAAKKAAQKNQTKNAPKNPPAGNARVLYKLDLSAQQPFALRSKMVATDPNNKQYQLLSQTGSGTRPTGWRDAAWHLDTQMEFFSDTAGGVPTLGVRNVQGPGAAMFLAPPFETGGGPVQLRIDYSSAAPDRQFIVRFKAADDRPAWDVAQLTGTGSAWRVETITPDLKGATSGHFEFHNREASPDAAVRIRALTVSETVPGNSAAPPAALVKANAFKLDLAPVAPFRAQKEWTRHTGGDTPKLPPGVTYQCWKRDAAGEFRCEDAGGSKALGITNLSDSKSGQFGFELEKSMGVTLRPGAAYQAKIEYLTRNEAAGWLSVQTAETKPVASAPLRNSAGQWKTETVAFTRGDQPIRLTIENTAVGEGNTLLFRALEVNEVEPAAAAPRDAGAVYSMTFDGVPLFRKSVEQGRASAGGEERLPPHVQGLCWGQGATGEFHTEVIDGVKAIGFANFTDKKSAQLLVTFENVPGGELVPGKTYAARVVYRTASNATGRVAVQGGSPDYTKYGTVDTARSDAWKTAEVKFARPHEKVSVAIDNTSVGAGNILYVRSIEIVEAE